MNDIVVQQSQEVAPPKTVAHEMVSNIAKMVLNPDIDADKFEKIVKLQVMMMDRQAEHEFNHDFIMLQSELPIIAKKGNIQTAVKNKQGEKTGEYRTTSTYSRFEDIMEAISPLLQKYGFSLSHTSEYQQGLMNVITILRHKGGHSTRTSIVLPMDKENALKSGMQSAKSTFSFGKRTNTIACLNIQEASEDSDTFKNQTITTEQAYELELLIEATKSDRDRLIKLCGVDSMDNITIDKYNWAMGILNAKVKQEGKKI